MGNTKSLSTTTTTGILRRPSRAKPSLAMMMAARKVFLKKVHILMLRFSMGKDSDEYGMIQREGFDRALERANLQTFEIFDLLFTVWENSTSTKKISVREFCMGMAPLACPSDDIVGVLQFALRVNDEPNRKYIEWKEVYELLTGINSTASFFGDPNLVLDEIDEIIETVFGDKDQISLEECIRRLSINPYVLRFASGKARTKVNFRDVLETKYIFDKEKLVTEYTVACMDDENKDKDDDNTSPPLRDKYSTPIDHLNDAPSNLAPKKLFGTKNHMADHDYDTPVVDENSGFVGNTKTPRDPPAVKKIGRQSFPSFTGFSPSIPRKVSRDPP